MSHSQAGTRATYFRTLKKYFIAVLSGIFLGGAYAVAGPILEAQAHPLLPTVTPASPPHMAKSHPSRDACTQGAVGIVVALPISVAARGAEWSPAQTGESACSWAI